VHDARHHLAVRDARESLAFVLPLPGEGLGVIAYTWVNGAGNAGSLLGVFGPGLDGEPVTEVVDGRDVPREMGFDDWCVGGMRVQLGEPLWSAHIDFAGEQLDLDYHFEGMHPAYAYGGHADGCPWYLADDRFEQSGTAKGVLRIGDRQIPFTTTTHRDHSWGTRNWGAPQHWKWVLAQAGPEVGVHFISATALGRTDLRGYVHKDGVTAEVIALEEEDFVLGPDLMHRSYEVELLDDADRTTTLCLVARAAYPFLVSPALTLNEVAMEALVDGQPGVGHVEMAWTNEYLDRARGDAGIVARLEAECAARE
jgi:hypothetical protein